MKPRALKPGNTLAYVSPASPVEPERLTAMTALLEAEGYRIKMMPSALARSVYLAGSDQERARDLQDAFDDPEVDAVLCTRGGYGCARLLPHLDLDRIAASGKMFLGFSDITTLHLALNRRGLATVHAPMAVSFATQRDGWVYESFKRVLKGESATPEGAPRGVTAVSGRAQGVVTGGCLCLICDSIGTAENVDAQGKIVLMEDVGEAPHRIDAMLTHLLNAGLIQTAAGIVVGEMTDTDGKIEDGIGGRPWREIVRERLGSLGIPMIMDYPFGHGKNMLSLPLGIRAELDADAGTLTYLEGLCA
jgi:muramoyltetrapeptide carboxypeptidase